MTDSSLRGSAVTGEDLLARFTNVRKTMAGAPLLDIAEVALKPGFCTVLHGRNGAGKTTLLRILGGLEAPDAADVELDRAIRPWQEACAALRRVAIYLHQQPYLFDRSVAANVAYGLRKRGVRGSKLERQVRDSLEWAGLSHLHSRNARQLSGGEKQRVVLTRARVLSPRLLLLDEPTASMDQEAREQTQFLVRRLRSEGVAVMIATHDGRQLDRLGDEVLELHEGEVRIQSDPDRAGSADNPGIRTLGNP
jgi:tungstate transport system ATP-binding protein